jgi:hypothetical protein
VKDFFAINLPSDFEVFYKITKFMGVRKMRRPATKL